MGGIVGLLHTAVPKPVDPAHIRAMIGSLAHRVPDREGVWTAPGVGFGHRRLAIIDVASSPQPMASAKGAITVIYNKAELLHHLRIAVRSRIVADVPLGAFCRAGWTAPLSLR